MDGTPDSAPIYPDDAFAWSLDQAAALRRLGASGLALPNDLDLPMIIEEIEAVGREQLLALQGNLTQALLHLLKLALQPEAPSARHWRKETLAFLVHAQRRYRRSMHQALDVEGISLDVRRRAAAEFEAEDLPLAPLPLACPVPVEALLDGAAEPRSLARDMALALTTAPPV